MKLKIEWKYYGQLFIGIGFIIGKEIIGIIISNLFIGWERE